MRRTEVVVTREQASKKILERLEYFGFNKNQIKQLLKQHDEDYLLANIAIIEEQLAKGKAIKNVRAYLSKAFVIDFRTPEGGYQKALIAKEEEKEQQVAAEKQAEQTQEILKAQFQAERKEQLAQLKSKLTIEEMAALKAEFEAEIMTTDFFSQMYKSKGFEHSIIQVKREKFLTERFLASEYQKFENYAHSKSGARISISDEN